MHHSPSLFLQKTYNDIELERLTQYTWPFLFIGKLPPLGSGWVKSVTTYKGLLIPYEYGATSTSYFATYVYMPEDDELNHSCVMGGSYYMNESCNHLCMDFRYELDMTSYAVGSRIVSC